MEKVSQSWANLNLKLTDCFDGVRGDMRELFELCARQQRRIGELEKQITNLRDIVNYYKKGAGV